MPEKFLFHGRINIICQFERANYLSFGGKYHCESSSWD